MTLEEIRSECSGIAPLLQPYVDGELAAGEQQQVGEHLERCRGCRAAVQEQQWVRATLRGLPREVAPAALRARITAALDAEDRNQPVLTPVEPVTRPPHRWWSRAWSGVRAAIPGAVILVPAAAMAVGLFVLTRLGIVEFPDRGLGAAMAPHPVLDVPTQAQAPSNRGALSPTTSQADTQPRRGRLQLIEARLSEPGRAQLRYELHQAGQPTGFQVIDLQAPTGGPAVSGVPVMFEGHRYVLDHTGSGDPVLYFELGDTSHTLILEGGPKRPRSAKGPKAQGQAQTDAQAHDHDFSVLLHVARDDLAGAASATR